MEWGREGVNWINLIVAAGKNAEFHHFWAHTGWMVKLDEYLNGAEFGSLEIIRDGGAGVPKHHKERLLQLGYIQKDNGTVAITDAGKMRLALGK
jgi:hypothetical protein